MISAPDGVAAMIFIALSLAVASRWRRVRGTTLVGPLVWTVLALAMLAASLFTTSDAWRYAAACGVFCPALSVLGAKRPQDKAWHFIVASLWGMLALPALEALALRPGQPLAIIDARAWFLVVLIGLSVLVYLPTRHALSALLLAAGQASLFWPYLPLVGGAPSPWQALVAAGCWLLALALALRPRRAIESEFDRAWLHFRDAFGALWGARVLERINAAAAQYAWPIRLGWSGFHAAADFARPAEFTPELAEEVRRTMTNLLRRFL